MRVRGLFSPASLPGLAAWNDASDTSTVLTSVGADVPATNGQTVRRWVDKSVNNRHLEQGVLANQPVWNATGGANGRSFLAFNGAGMNMTSIIPSQAQPWMALFVFRKATIIGAAEPLLRFNSPAPFFSGRSDIDASASKFFSTYGTNRRIEAFSNVTTWRNGVAFASGVNSFIRLDSADWSYPTGSPGTGAATGVSQIMSAQGEVAEIILAANATPELVLKLSNYALAKYGV
jgi:hypothetical protein